MAESKHPHLWAVAERALAEAQALNAKASVKLAWMRLKARSRLNGSGPPDWDALFSEIDDAGGIDVIQLAEIDPDEHPVERSMLVPFVAVASQGGPYDDNSFIAGFACGEAWGAVGAGQRFEKPVYPALLDQLDLIAMHFGATIAQRVAEGMETEWAHVVIVPKGAHA